MVAWRYLKELSSRFPPYSVISSLKVGWCYLRSESCVADSRLSRTEQNPLFSSFPFFSARICRATYSRSALFPLNPTSKRLSSCPLSSIKLVKRFATPCRPPTLGPCGTVSWVNVITLRETRAFSMSSLVVDPLRFDPRFSFHCPPAFRDLFSLPGYRIYITDSHKRF